MRAASGWGGGPAAVARPSGATSDEASGATSDEATMIVEVKVRRALESIDGGRGV
jgi:hypothetical protein